MSAATISLYFRQLLLAQLFNPAATAPLEVLYVALTRAVAVANATGSQLDEPTTGSYGRVAYPVDNVNWMLTDYAQAYNLNDVLFAAATSDWGLMQGYALCTDPTAGATLAVGRLTSPIYVASGMPIAVRAGSMYLELTD